MEKGQREDKERETEGETGGEVDGGGDDKMTRRERISGTGLSQNVLLIIISFYKISLHQFK